MNTVQHSVGILNQVTIVIPALNEEESIGMIIRSVQEMCRDYISEIIVIDDGSIDTTGKVAEQHGARVIRHSHQMGYGASLKTGIRQAKTEYILTMDADGQHRAEDVRAVCENAESCDMVVGNRVELMHSPLWRMPGKWFINLLANHLTKARIPDLNSGLRIFRRKDVLKYLHLLPGGFSFSTTMTMIFLNRGYSVRYVSIKVLKRAGKSTVSIKTGFETFILILRLSTLIDPLRIFIPFSLLTGAIGICWAIPYVLKGSGVSVGSMLAIVTSLIFFALGLISDQISQLRMERYE